MNTEKTIGLNLEMTEAQLQAIVNDTNIMLSDRELLDLVLSQDDTQHIRIGGGVLAGRQVEVFNLQLGASIGLVVVDAENHRIIA